jgi:HK97 family phage portal protein
MFSAFKQLLSKGLGQNSPRSSYFLPIHGASWMNRDYSQFAEEAYVKNVIAHRSISLIAQAAASIPLMLYKKQNNRSIPISSHPILNLITRPNPTQSGKEFFEMIYSYRQISGNAFVLGIGNDNRPPIELYALRPDRITVVAGKNLLPESYRYQANKDITDFKVDPLTGKSRILQIKNFHPLSDWYGLSTIEAAAYSIDQHNQAGQWNQALLQNGARPSGALVVKGEGDKPGRLTETQFIRLKASIDEIFSGARNAGRPLLLEGGLEWREMSMSPKDMDFIEAKHSSARDIALALGVPPQMLGIPGDNTYSNLQEARLAFWEQTVIPIAENVIDNFNHWLGNFFGHEYELVCNTDEISALADKREKVWKRIAECPFMTINEKRQAVGLADLKDGDRLV